MTDEELIARLAAVTAHVIVDPEVLSNWSRDWWSFTAKLEDDDANVPAVAVIPECVADVVAIAQIAGEADRSVIVKGGGSNVVGAIEPHPRAILIDLRGLNVIEPVQEQDGTVRVDAGVIGGELEARLNELGFTLGHYPDSLHYSTVGGWIATRAIGSFSTKYGGIEELIEGIDVVLADGTIVSEKPSPRHGAGPRLADLFLGSEGAFGIVTAATLRVWPLPEDRRFRAWDVPSFDGALEAIRTVLHRGIMPAAIRLYDETATRDAGEQFGTVGGEHLVIAVFDGPAELVALELRMLDAELIAAGGRDLGAEPALAWFGSRHRADWLLDANERDGWLADRIDVTAHWSRLAAVRTAGLAALRPIAATAGAHATHFTHSGGMLAFTFAVAAEDDERALLRYREAWFAVLRAVIDAGGGIVHHNGIGQARLPWLAEELGTGLAVLGLLKRAFDPEEIFSPGRLLP
jgi:alkyldihydroxyacetonephosphate synthase